MKKIVNILKNGVADKEYYNNTFKWVFFFDGIAVVSTPYIYIETPTDAAKMCAVNVWDKTYPKNSVLKITEGLNGYKNILTTKGEIYNKIPDFEMIKPKNQIVTTGRINVKETLEKTKGYDVLKIDDKHFMLHHLTKILKIAEKLKIKELDYTFYESDYITKFSYSDFYSLCASLLDFQADGTDLKMIEI